MKISLSTSFPEFDRVSDQVEVYFLESLYVVVGCNHAYGIQSRMPLERRLSPSPIKPRPTAATPSFTAEGALVSPRGNAHAVLLLRSGEVVGSRAPSQTVPPTFTRSRIV